MKMIDKMLMKKETFELALLYGSLIFLGLTVYFLTMYAVGLIHILELRFLNLFIMLAGIYSALRQFRRLHNGEMNYFRALALGTATAFVGTSIFTAFLFLFLQFEGNLMHAIQVNEPIGRHVNPYIASCVVQLEGVLSGFGLTYILGNFMSTDQATKPVGGNIPMADHDGNYTSRVTHS